MQNRMKEYQLSAELTSALLEKVQTGSLATINADSTPYVAPVHFVYVEGCIYVHGLPKGQKISNIKARPSVSFTAFEMTNLLLDPDEEPCETNTEYQSVIITGTASTVEDTAQKKMALQKVVEKYTPSLAGKEIPINMVNETAVIQISIQSMTGKYYA